MSRYYGPGHRQLATEPRSIADAGGGAGPYYSSRGDSETWMEVGLRMISQMGSWAARCEKNASLSGTIIGLEVANEPGLGFPGIGSHIQQLHARAIPELQQVLKLAKMKANVTVNFIGLVYLAFLYRLIRTPPCRISRQGEHYTPQRC